LHWLINAGNPKARQRFLREARAAAALEHDNVVTIHQVSEDNGTPFLAMPLLKGESLEDRLRRDGRLPIAEVLRVGREIAEGLAAAHEHGLIHRDIKPGNLWLEGSRRRVKILDFGLARPAAGGQDDPVTEAGTVLGTPAYMAPEQARGEEVDGRCDLFSLGCVLYRMLTGTPPFRGEGTMAILTSLATHTPETPAALNPAVRLWAKYREQRPASAQAVAEELTAITAEQEKTQRLDPSGKEAPRPDQALASAAKASEETVSVSLDRLPSPGRKAGRQRTVWLVAVVLLALLPMVWWLATVVLRVETANGTLVVEIKDDDTEARIKDGKLILTGPDDKVRYILSPSERSKELTPRDYKVHIEGADGLILDTTEFTLKKDGKVTVRVTAARRIAAKVNDPDRQAAEYVLSIGGVVQVNDLAHKVEAAAQLPRDTFRLVSVVLNENKKVSDAGLAHFQGCKDVTYLDLTRAPVGDAGLAHFKDCKKLRVLGLGGMQGCEVGDAGLAHFKECKDLQHLYVPNTKVSDAGLAYFKECKELRRLHLGATRVGDAGLAHLANCKELTELFLNSTQTSDVGLDRFKGCKNLTHLSLVRTKVTAAKVEEMRKALPRCKIEWDGGVIEPRMTEDPDRTAAEYVLSIGGGVMVKGQQRPIRAAANLPRVAFELTGIDLHENKKVNDAGLAHFKNCKNLTSLNLGGTKVSDAGLVHFKDCKGLATLVLWDTQIGDGGLAHFKDCKDLRNLDLRGTKVIDLTPLKVMPLKELRCDFKPDRDTETLRSIKSLETINGKPAAEFWKEVEAKTP
jgi:serine/threonine protein kinase/Leucine-rich repeat (LRR) protein